MLSRKTNNFLIYCIGLIVLLVGGYFFNIRLIKRWGIYRNNQYSLVFAYPSNYKISIVNNCYGLVKNQDDCLISLSLDPNISKYLPKAYFFLVKNINTVNLSGQVRNVRYDAKEKSWIYQETNSPDKELSFWDYTRSGQKIIKVLIGGSHGSSYSYIIPDYKNDRVAVFMFPQSFRLRCDDFDKNKSQQVDCNNFYKTVINRYNGGKLIVDSWLPENYIQMVFADAEKIVKSFTTINSQN